MVRLRVVRSRGGFPFAPRDGLPGGIEADGSRSEPVAGAQWFCVDISTPFNTSNSSRHCPLPMATE